MAMESATVDTLIKEKTHDRFPHLAKLLAKFPDAAHHDYRQLFREQLQALKPGR